METIGWAVYWVIQVLFIPVIFVGMIVTTLRQILVSKKLGVSATALSVISMRWVMDMFGIRKDEATRRLYPLLPNGSAFGMWALYFPFYVQYRLSGVYPSFVAPQRRGYETPFKVAMTRTLLFDQLIRKMSGKVDQFVIMGAGYDTRCYAGPMASGVRRFELDQANTLQLKRACLKRAGIETGDVRFVTVDFKTESWPEKLKQAGYDPAKKALFLWEGVTLYLTEDEVRGTLRELKALSCPGSVLMMDVYASRMLKLKGVGATGELFRFTLDFAREPDRVLREFIESEGLALGEAEWMGQLTSEGAFGVVAEVLGTP